MAQLNGAIKAAWTCAATSWPRSPRRDGCARATARSRTGPSSLDKFLEPEAVRAVVADHHQAGLDAVDVAVMDLADKVADDATAVTEADIERLRALGLSDTEIFDVVARRGGALLLQQGARRRSASQADARFAQLDPELRGALTVGRPIAAR